MLFPLLPELMKPKKIHTIKQVKIVVEEVPTMEEMLDLFNDVQECLEIGKEYEKFQIDPKMNIECVLPINKAFNTVSKNDLQKEV